VHLLILAQDMSKLLQLNDMWKNAGTSGQVYEPASGVRESSYIENPEVHEDVRVRVGYVVATRAAAEEMQAKHRVGVPVAVLGEDPNESNIAQALRSLQVGSHCVCYCERLIRTRCRMRRMFHCAAFTSIWTCLRFYHP
jgi:hypothetical protein